MGALLDKLIKSLSPEQFCISCILLTVGATTYGVQTFARNRDVEEIREQQLAEAIFTYRIKQCEAIRQRTPSEAYGRLVSDSISRYEDKTKRRARLLSCSDL